VAAGAGGGALASSPGSSAPRVIATVLAGGALAAAGQTALTEVLPLAADGTDVLKVGVQQFLGAPTPPVTAPLVDLTPAVAAVAAEPRPVDVGDLVKAADLHRRAAQPAPAVPRPGRAVPRPDRPARSADPAAPTPPPAAPPARARAAAPRVAAGEVQMVSGRVTSGFGARWGRQHRGLDIAAPVGTPIRAPLAGEVIASGPASGFGLWVRVRHGDGTVTTYGHVHRTLVRVGQQVEAGQEIAQVGNRGRSTGPHLHVEVQTPGGTTVNPRPWLDGHGIGY
jgi:murein DD-endopeptidase MepM/ murein hydrolase activator NlpD